MTASNVVPIQIPDSLPQFKRPPGLPETCSDEMLMEAVKASLCGAAPEELAKMLGVPAKGVKYWMNSREWQSIKAYVWPEVKGLVHNELVSVRSKALQLIGKRLHEGDPYYDLSGEFKGYRPLKANDLVNVLQRTSEVVHQIEKELGVVSDDSGRPLCDVGRRHVKCSPSSHRGD
jgi:hypothetical protein